MNEEMPGRNTNVRSEVSGRFSGGEQRRSWMGWIIAVVVIVVLVVLAVVFRDKLFKGGMSEKSGSRSEYQAVFLTNGQVYFGKFKEAGDNYAELSDIYYLQVTTPPLQGSGDQAQKQQPELKLVKLGNELHGPMDKMHINASQILFYEDLKTDGKVVDAIKQYQKNPNATTPPATQQQSAPATGTVTQPTTGQPQTVPANNKTVPANNQ
jgi:hypothetical protein